MEPNERPNLAHLYYYKDDEGAPLLPLLPGWAITISFDRNDSCIKPVWVGFNDTLNLRFICWISSACFITNCAIFKPFSYLRVTPNRNLPGYVPFASRHEAKNVEEIFGSPASCLEHLNKWLRRSLKDPLFDIRTIQDSERCVLYRRPNSWRKSNSYVTVQVTVNSVEYSVLFHHMIKYAIEEDFLYKTDKNGNSIHLTDNNAANIDLSHRCHQKECGISRHYVFESQSSNRKRNCRFPHPCKCGILPACILTTAVVMGESSAKIAEENVAKNVEEKVVKVTSPEEVNAKKIIEKARRNLKKRAREEAKKNNCAPITDTINEISPTTVTFDDYTIHREQDSDGDDVVILERFPSPVNNNNTITDLVSLLEDDTPLPPKSVFLQLADGDHPRSPPLSRKRKRVASVPKSTPKPTLAEVHREILDDLAAIAEQELIEAPVEDVIDQDYFYLDDADFWAESGNEDEENGEDPASDDPSDHEMD